MEGVVELAEEVFHTQVRLGEPTHVKGLLDVVRNPIHATGVGLLLYGKQYYEDQTNVQPQTVGLRDVFERMVGWFKKSF